MDYLKISLAHKVNRLFDFYHRRGEPQVDVQSVAVVLGQKLDRQIDPDYLSEMRKGSISQNEVDQQLRNALCAFFGVDQAYLTETSGRDIDIDQRLRLWIIVRDKGLDYFAARANGLTRVEFEALIAEVQALPAA
ncbi:hypothetical protein ASH04_23745 [Rhodococcus sp. Leaf233]|jgi:hypothetical protein|nr:MULTISPECIES: hypothetical protein [Rhodococcus]KQU35689.1 hypothetical protein ASH04_23745 [Rhodococcus sp. Leaf233]MBP2527490.1 hypothetical protein [Rhodococcus sp. PvP104]WQH31297.1 hypothetical protein U2G91_26190 [Rhodococcus fascians]